MVGRIRSQGDLSGCDHLKAYLHIQPTPPQHNTSWKMGDAYEDVQQDEFRHRRYELKGVACLHQRHCLGHAKLPQNGRNHWTVL